MKDSLVFPGFDPDDNKDNDVDLQIDFTQFLEEAKRFANENKLHYPIAKEQNGKKEVLNQEKKPKKKSWKSTFFSFWRSSSEKKAKQHSKDTSKSSHNSTNPKQRQCFSGPVYDMEGAASGGRRWRQAPVSGPITGVWPDQKDETPYVSLERFKEGQYDVKTYGPVYLVS